MKKYIRVCFLPNKQECGIAIEFISENYLPHKIEIPEESVVWKTAEPLLASDLIELLRARGWHPTDIRDELDEARKSHRLA